MPTVIVNYVCMALIYSVNNYWPIFYIQRSNFIVFLSYGSTTQDGLSLLYDVQRSHSGTANSVRLLWTNDNPWHRPLPDNTQH